MEQQKGANPPQQDEFVKLSFKDRYGFAMGDFSQNLIFGTVGGFLLFYMTAVAGLSAAIGATIFLVVRWVNVFWDPWVGATVDRRPARKTGKYKSYIKVFGIPLVVISALLFLPSKSIFGGNVVVTVIWAFASYLACALIYSWVNIPYSSMTASLTRDNVEVGRLTTARMTMANTANLLVYTCFPLFVQLATPYQRKMTNFGLGNGLKLPMGNYASPHAAGSWFGVFAVYMVLGAIGLFLAYRSITERVMPDAHEGIKYSDLWREFRDSKPLRILSYFFLVGFTFMFFGNTVWPFFVQYNIGHPELMFAIGLIGSIPGIFLVFLWPMIRRWIGKKAFFELFLAIFIVGSIFLFFWTKNPSSIALGYIGRFLQQWGLTAATGFMWALVPEVVAYDEWHTGKRVAGIINSLLGLFYKIGLALGGIIPGYILAATGFKSTVSHQTPGALSGLVVSMIWIPVVLAVVAGIVMMMYPISDADVDRMNDEVVARKAKEAEEAAAAATAAE